MPWSYPPRTCSICLFLMVLTAVGACANRTPKNMTAMGAKKLESGQLLALLTGATIEMEEYSGKAKVTLHDDGSIQAINQEMVSSDGHWAIEGDKLCLQFRKWGNSDRLCYTVFQENDRFVQFRDKVYQLNRQPQIPWHELLVISGKGASSLIHPSA